MSYLYFCDNLFTWWIQIYNKRFFGFFRVVVEKTENEWVWFCNLLSTHCLVSAWNVGRLQGPWFNHELGLFLLCDFLYFLLVSMWVSFPGYQVFFPVPKTWWTVECVWHDLLRPVVDPEPLIFLWFCLKNNTCIFYHICVPVWPPIIPFFE